MSEQPIPGQIVTGKLIASLAARTALETPGVLRTEPTVQGLLTRLGPAVIRKFSGAGGPDGVFRDDGVTVTLSGGTARVHLDIATDIAYTALNVAEALRERIREIIRHTGLVPGEVEISILAIECDRGTTTE